MPDIILQVPRTQYPSLQINDIGYYAPMESTGGFEVNIVTEDLVEIGPITAIDNTTSLEDGTVTTSLTLTIDQYTEEPTEQNYIFFAKNDREVIVINGIEIRQPASNINTVSLIGYYGSVKFVNTDSNKAEMFAASCEISESSK